MKSMIPFLMIYLFIPLFLPLFLLLPIVPPLFLLIVVDSLSMITIIVLFYLPMSFYHASFF